MFFGMAHKHGARFVWADEAVVHESIPPSRITRAWLMRRAFYGGRTYVRVLARLEGGSRYFTEGCKGLLGVMYFAPLALIATLTCLNIRVDSQKKVLANIGKIMARVSRSGEYGK